MANDQASQRIQQYMCHFNNPLDVCRLISSKADIRPEADFLADRLGIMVQGSIRCTGTARHLKREYGSGCKLTITCPLNAITRANIDR